MREIIRSHFHAEFTSVVEGIEINGVDIITWDENGKITISKYGATSQSGQ